MLQSATVLLPHGQPVDPIDRNALQGFLFHCGGDLCRFIDGPCNTLDRFVRHVSRIGELHRPGSQAIIALTSTRDEFISIFHCRQVLSEEVQNLRRSLWVVFAAVDDMPRLLTFARESGRIEDEQQDEVRLWSTSSGERFLIASRACTDITRIKRLVDVALTIPDGRSTGAFRRNSSTFAAVAPPPSDPFTSKKP